MRPLSRTLVELILARSWHRFYRGWSVWQSMMFIRTFSSLRWYLDLLSTLNLYWGVSYCHKKLSSSQVYGVYTRSAYIKYIIVNFIPDIFIIIIVIINIPIIIAFQVLCGLRHKIEQLSVQLGNYTALLQKAKEFFAAREGVLTQPSLNCSTSSQPSAPPKDKPIANHSNVTTQRRRSFGMFFRKFSALQPIEDHSGYRY